MRVESPEEEIRKTEALIIKWINKFSHFKAQKQSVLSRATQENENKKTDSERNINTVSNRRGRAKRNNLLP